MRVAVAIQRGIELRQIYRHNIGLKRHIVCAGQVCVRIRIHHTSLSTVQIRPLCRVLQCTVRRLNG
jgi:hypothetical protein